MNPEIDKLINLALTDGQVTDKEREIILRKAEKLGLDLDEVEMYLESNLGNLKLENNVINVDNEIEKLIFNHPVTGERIEVALNDFPNSMTWEAAIEACNYLGNNWRLPSIIELKTIYELLYKKGIGNFFNNYVPGTSRFHSFYWSCESYNKTYISGYLFDIGEIFENHKGMEGNTRAVRNL
jgi:hypothetical protein